MKKIIYILVSALVFGFASCTVEDESPSVEEGQTKSITFSVNIPDAVSLSRAAWTAEELSGNLLIDNMYVLVFDENGFISRHKAYPSGGGPAEFTVELPTSSNKRILHFVCNYDWEAAGFDDFAAKNQNEATVVATMSVNYPRIAYWRRMVLNKGITSATSFEPVTLMRNVAKISIVNNSLAAANQSVEVSSYLSDLTFAIGNYYDKGTVALFDKTSGEFVNDIEATNGIMYEAPGVSKQDIDESADFVRAYVGNLGNPGGQSVFTYEHRKTNPGSKDRVYIILKAKYHKNESDPGTEKYYKIDIALPPPSEDLYDLHRNRHYVITLGTVIHVGYTSFSEAVNGLSLNNFATSLEQEYNSISDGEAILNIEYVNKTFVKPKANFAVRYSYIYKVDAFTSATNNENVSGVVSHGSVQAIDLPEGELRGTPHLPNQKGVTQFSDDYLDRVNGDMVGTLPSGNTVAESSIRISKLGLSRTIVLKLRQPYVFGSVSIPNDIAPYAEEPVDITFTIPAELQDNLPFFVYVEGATMLMPVSDSGVYYEDMGSTFRYRYKVINTGEHTLKFQTGSRTGGGRITLKADMFTDYVSDLIER